MELECLIRNFEDIFQEIRRQRIVEKEHILDYKKASKGSLHGILQYVLIFAGINCGFVAVPEYKVIFKEPLKKREIDERIKSTRKQWQMKVDVAFVKGPNLEGVGEVYTLDEVHGVWPSRKMDDPWLTPYNKLRHMIEDKYFKDTKFLVITNVLPKNLPQDKLPWKDSKKRPIEAWENSWKNLAKELSKTLDVGHIIIYEDDAESHIYERCM